MKILQHSLNLSQFYEHRIKTTQKNDKKRPDPFSALLGSTVAVADVNGNVTDRWDYSSYGTETHTTGNSDTPFRFHGALGCMTDSNGLVYMRARTYNPRTMRFLQADPLGFAAGMNFYAAFNNNPILYVDPDGENPILLWMLAGGVIGAVFDGGTELLIQYYSNPDQPINWRKVGGASARGFVTGAISSVAGPAAGSAVRMVGGKATGWVAQKVLSPVIAGIGSGAGQVANNVITGEPWHKDIGSAAAAGVVGQAASAFLFPNVRGFGSLAQSNYFAPRHIASMIATVNARRALAGYATSTVVGWTVNETLTTVNVTDIEGCVVPRTARDVHVKVNYEDGSSYEHDFRK